MKRGEDPIGLDPIGSPLLSVDDQLDPKAKDDHYQNQEPTMFAHRVLLSRGAGQAVPGRHFSLA